MYMYNVYLRMYFVCYNGIHWASPSEYHTHRKPLYNYDNIIIVHTHCVNGLTIAVHITNYFRSFPHTLLDVCG